MENPPPPPPPHGEGRQKRGGLPDGNYDIFIIPPHAAGSGFLYLPSLQPNVNSFAAGFASALLLVFLYTITAPAFVAWWHSVKGQGGVMALIIMAVGVGAWALGRTQTEGVGGAGIPGGVPGSGPPPTGHAHSSSHGAGGARMPGAGAGPMPGAGAYPGAGSMPRGAPGAGGPKSGTSWQRPPEPEPNASWHSPPDPQPDASWNSTPEPEAPPTPRPQPQPQPQPQAAPPRPQPQAAPPRPQPAAAPPRPQPVPKPPPPKAAPPPPKPQSTAWERSKEETRRKEAERKAKEEAKQAEEAARKKKEEEDRRRKELVEKLKQAREKEKAEREAREAREKRDKEAAEARQKEAREREAREREAREREAQEREAREREAREKKEKEEAEKKTRGMSYSFPAVGEKTNLWPNGRPAVPAAQPSSPVKPAPSPAAATPAAKPSPAPSPMKETSKRPPAPTAHSYHETEDSYSYRPYDKPKWPAYRRNSQNSLVSESSYAPSHSTAQTTPPPSRRGKYTNKDPDKIIIKAVYSFNNTFIRTPSSQLLSGVGSVTDGLILRITTEGLFIDDDVRGVAQREWDVKAWTLKTVETGKCDTKGLHVLRASIRDAEGKRFLFVLGKEEAWKVVEGLARLRRGTQVRQLGFVAMSDGDARSTLEGLGWF